MKAIKDFRQGGHSFVELKFRSFQEILGGFWSIFQMKFHFEKATI